MVTAIDVERRAAEYAYMVITAPLSTGLLYHELLAMRR
jgi:hypothetical protein